METKLTTEEGEQDQRESQHRTPEAPRELGGRAVPLVAYWGPAQSAHARKLAESHDIPDGLTYSA